MKKLKGTTNNHKGWHHLICKYSTQLPHPVLTITCSAQTVRKLPLLRFLHYHEENSKVTK